MFLFGEEEARGQKKATRKSSEDRFEEAGDAIRNFDLVGLGYLLQPEQLLDEQEPHEELAVLLNFPPAEKAKADMTRATFLLLHLGQEIFSEELKTSFSNSCWHCLH